MQTPHACKPEAKTDTLSADALRKMLLQVERDFLAGWLALRQNADPQDADAWSHAAALNAFITGQPRVYRGKEYKAQSDLALLLTVTGKTGYYMTKEGPKLLELLQSKQETIPQELQAQLSQFSPRFTSPTKYSDCYWLISHAYSEEGKTQAQDALAKLQ